MKARMLKALALVLALSLALSSTPVLSESAGTAVQAIPERMLTSAEPGRLPASLALSSLPESAETAVRAISLRALASIAPDSLAAYLALPKGTVPIRSIVSTGSVSVQKGRTFTVTVKVRPATQAALNDAMLRWDSSQLSLMEDPTFEIKSSTLIFHIAFQSVGTTGKTSIKVFSAARTSLKDTTKVTVTPVRPSSVSLSASFRHDRGRQPSAIDGHRAARRRRGQAREVDDQQWEGRHRLLQRPGDGQKKPAAPPSPSPRSPAAKRPRAR